mmetsp:Transcript_14016/g.35384  ORF Transcript_14016/g.35384 Transcript_14016/m.35384 type:complete len:240 (+) Transcript_14016:195-914(+)
MEMLLNEWHAAVVDGGGEPASALLSRSYTIAAALNRLGRKSGDGSGELEVHVIGADREEGASPAASAAHFSPLCRTLASCGGVTHLRLLLAGPHVTPALDGTTHSNLCGLPGEATLTLEYDTRLYHERLAAGGAPPAAVFAFNAGVWGYDSWLPSLAAAVNAAPVIVTSYNELEADDDLGTLETGLAAAGLTWAWGPEPNPFASQLCRESAAVPGRHLADNSHWQCFSTIQTAASDVTT